MESQKLKENEVELVRTGGFGAGLTMLEIGGVDVVPVAEPLWSKNQGKYKLIAAAPDILRALERGGRHHRRSGENEGRFHPRRDPRASQSGRIHVLQPEGIGRDHRQGLRPRGAVAESTVRNLLASEKKGGVPYWGPGDIRIDTMDNMIRAQKIVGALKGDADWSKLIDESFLRTTSKQRRSEAARRVARGHRFTPARPRCTRSAPSTSRSSAASSSPWSVLRVAANPRCSTSWRALPRPPPEKSCSRTGR